jgi:hypothetical protein
VTTRRAGRHSVDVGDDCARMVGAWFLRFARTDDAAVESYDDHLPWPYRRMQAYVKVAGMGYCRSGSRVPVKLSLMTLFLKRFKTAAAEGAAVKLKLRLLAGTIPSLQVLHSDFREARDRLNELKIETPSGGVSKIQLPVSNTAEASNQNSWLESRCGSTLVSDLSTEAH